MMQLAGIKIIERPDMPRDKVAIGHFVMESKPSVEFVPDPTDDPLSETMSFTIVMEMPKVRFVGVVLDVSRS